MITFGVRFYNATTSEWITDDYRQASIASYNGTRLLETEQSDVENLLPGEINEFSIDRGTNIARLLKGMYHTIIDEGGPISEIRACLTRDTSHNYIAYEGSGALIFADHNGRRQQWKSFFDVDTDPPFFFTNAGSIHDIFPLYYDKPVIFGCVITEETRVMLLPRDYLLTSYPMVEETYIENALVSRCISNDNKPYTKYSNLSLPLNQTGLVPFTYEITSPTTGAKYNGYNIVSMWGRALTNSTVFVTERFDSGQTYQYNFGRNVSTFDYTDPDTGWEGQLYFVAFADSNDSLTHDATIVSKNPAGAPSAANITDFMHGVTVMTTRNPIYYTLKVNDAGGSDVDPDNPPDPDEPPKPIPPDNPDPYYDPTSDPDSPEYDPTKDPDSPEYDPTDPKDPYRPPSTEGGGDPEVKPPVDPVTPPPTPPSHAINSRFVTLYTPSLSQLNDLAAYLWSPAWSIDGFKKIFANPIDCILGLMIFPALVAPSGSKEVNVGNLSTGVTMSYIDNQYVEVNCGSFEITEYYASYLDYDPYTKIEIYLPYIGTHRLSADDVMAKTIQLKYMIDLLSGACVAFLVVDGTTLYTFTGSCATPIPVSGNDWSNMVNGILSVAGAAAAAVISGGTAATMAAGAVASTSLFVSSHKEHIRHGGSVASAAGLMSIQTPYLIVTRPRQALPIGQNSFQGYPSFMTESLGSLSGYTEVESCHLEHIPCTDEELKEIERLLKGGVLF